jgi:hypothetical protein
LRSDLELMLEVFVFLFETLRALGALERLL